MLIRFCLFFNLTGDVTVAVLLDLTQGPLCIQKNAASMQSMNGILQTFQTLNSIQYLKGLKIGNLQNPLIIGHIFK
jgi:hypothetical protein